MKNFDKSGMVKNLNVTLDEQTAKLVHLGLRKNKKRAHLLVSNILGKHIPVNPHYNALSGAVLGAKVWNSQYGTGERQVSVSLIEEASEVLLDGYKSGTMSDEAETLFWLIWNELYSFTNTEGALENNASFATIGFAETATGLGANVAHALQSEYHHSTRDWEGREKFLTFEEEHSHATSHALVDVAPESMVVSADIPLILADDEFSTGKTLMNIITELHELVPERKVYYVVSLIDCRSAEHRSAMETLARKLNVSIRPITLVNGEVSLPDDIPNTVASIESEPLVELSNPSNNDRFNKVSYATGLTRNQMLDNQPLSHGRLIESVAPLSELANLIGLRFSDTLVLGREEFMYYPQRVAQHFKFHFSSTTRSPIMVFDREDYPVRNGVKFTMDDGTVRFAYNVGGFDNVILFQDSNLSDKEAEHMANTLSEIIPNVLVFKPEHVA